MMKSFLLKFEMVMNFDEPIDELASHGGGDLSLPTHILGIDFSYA